MTFWFCWGAPTGSKEWLFQLTIDIFDIYCIGLILGILPWQPPESSAVSNSFMINFHLGQKTKYFTWRQLRQLNAIHKLYVALESRVEMFYFFWQEKIHLR